MSNRDWFNDESIMMQEAVTVSSDEKLTTGIIIVVKNAEVILELDQLRNAVSYLESEF